MAEVFVFEKDASGTIASHPERVTLPVIAAPVPDEQKGDKFNAVRDPLVILGCKDLPDDHFEFDSSFVLPRAARAFTKLGDFLAARLNADQRPPPCALFGHADPTGSPAYNRMLSGRRATAAYGVLTKDPAIWDDLFSNGYRGDQWGTKSVQHMLSISLATLQPSGLPESPFYRGPIDGARSEATRNAISAWRKERGLGPGDTVQPHQRKLFKEYMDAICNGPTFKMLPTDFIAKGQGGKSLKGDVMGCGEFNPRFLLTADTVKSADKNPVLRELRNEAYATNRRVIIYVFKHGTEVDPGKWPCPVARSEDDSACQKRFWSDGAKRRAEAQDERTFGDAMVHLAADEAGQLVETPIEKTGNTMACRFYHGFARRSPCEAKFKEWVLRFQVPGINGQVQTLKNRRFVAILGESSSAPELRGTSDDRGVVRVPVINELAHEMRVKIDTGPELPPADGQAAPGDGAEAAVDDQSRFVTVRLAAATLEFRDTSNELGLKQRLYNLGFGERPPDTWSADELKRARDAFRVRFKLEAASEADVDDRIVVEHDLAGVPEPPPDEAAAAPAADT
jgi:hypothetical protein